MDFIVLDMDEDKGIPLILERPFIDTRRVLINVQQGKIPMRVEDEEVIFEVFKAMNFPSKVHSWSQLDDLYLGVAEPHVAKNLEPLFEVCYTHLSMPDSLFNDPSYRQKMEAFIEPTPNTTREETYNLMAKQFPTNEKI